MRRTAVLLVLLGLATFVVGLDRPAIGDSDEAYYAEAAREMLAGGDWLTPHYNFQPRFQKPILFYWLVAASHRVLGITEAAARLPAALSGIALGLLTAAIGRRWYDELTARYAGIIAMTSFGYFSIGRLALPDLPLALFITGSVWASLRADEAARPVLWVAIAGVLAGLGVLTKGPVTLVVLVLATVPALWLERRHAAIRRVAIVATIGTALALPWYAAMAAVHGRAYLHSFFIADNLERFATTRFNHPRALWFYLPVIAGGLLPWTPQIFCAARPLASWWHTRACSVNTRRLWLWAGLPLLFFTASIGKQPRYILPVLPPLAVLIAYSMRLDLHETGGRYVRLLGGMSAVVLIGVGLLLQRAAPAILLAWPAPTASLAWLIVFVGALAAIASVSPVPAHTPVAVGCAAAITLAGLQFALSPSDREPVREMAAAVLAERHGAEPIGTARVFVRNLVFYTGVPTADLDTDEEIRAFLSRPEPVLTIIRARDLARLQERTPLRVAVLRRIRFLNVSPVRLRVLLSRDPEGEMEPVLLVRNKVR